MSPDPTGERGQANLPALGVALLIVTAVAGMSFGIADGAYRGADRDAGERRVAVALSERLVSADTAYTARANVLNGTGMDRLTAARLRTAFPVSGGYDVRLRLGDRELVSTGEVADGTTIRRIVLVRRTTARSVQVSSGPDHATTLPRRTGRVTLNIRPPGGTTVTTVRANGRVVLRNASGLRGEFEVAVSRLDTTELTFEASGPLPPSSTTIAYYPAETAKAMLAVSVDG